MATAAIQANGEPRVVGDIIAIDACDIDASERLRPIDLAWATALGQIMLAEGQRTPIEVCRQKGAKRWRLVSGGHRHAAGTIFPDINPLRAMEVPGDELARREAEVSENLWRQELSPLDRAHFVAEKYDLLRARSGLDASASAQTVAANARWKKDLRVAAGDASDIMSRAYGWSALIGEQLQLSKRTIERDLMLARRLAPAVQERLRYHSVARNSVQLRALAKLEISDQNAVSVALQEGKAKTVADAMAQLRGRTRPNPEDRRLSAFIGTFGRMALIEKKGALGHLAGMLPAGWRLVEDKA